jgi:glycosyltransferase involved in cell wall biosynthesis
MKKTVPISIIIPTKNEEKYLPKLLKSIREQNVQPVEIIVADAKSSDRTVKIAHKYKAKVIDGGLPAEGKNNGAKIAQEDIFMFVDADVQFPNKGSLKRAYQQFKKIESDVSVVKVKLYGRKKGILKKLYAVITNFIQAIGQLNIGLLKAGTGVVILTKREPFYRVGGFDEKLHFAEDSDYIYKLFKARFNHKNIKERFIFSGRRMECNILRMLASFIGSLIGFFSLPLYRTFLFHKIGLWFNKFGKYLYGKLGGKINWDDYIRRKGYEEYKPDDRYLGYPSGVTNRQRKMFEFIPGFITWILLLFPVIFAVFKWNIPFVIYIAYLVAYWTVRSIKFVYGIAVGTKRMDKEINTDWISLIKKEHSSEYDQLRYIYLCPVYGEDLSILKPSFRAWANSTVDSKKIDVVFAMEDRKAEFQIDNFEKLKEEFGNRFGSMRYYIHPSDIPGEIAGVKGGNINWAARELVKEFKKEGKDLSKYLLITCDSDLRPHPKYLSAVTYKFLTIEEPKKHFYATAVHTFNNNIWRVPHIIRAQSNMLTLVLLQNWVINKKKHIPFSGEEIYVRDSFSSYIVNLETLQNYKFWDPEVVGDDTGFYWNVMARSKATFKSQEVYIPTYNDAVENENYLKSHTSYYKQQHRWGWGIANIPRMLAILWKDKDFPWYRKLFILNVIFETQIWYLSIVFVLTFGLNIMGWINPSYKFTVFAYNLPQLLSYIFTFITLTNIPIVIFRRKITPVPKNWKWYRHILDFAETALVTVNMLTFGFVPFIQAQTEMMFGKDGFKRNFYVTEKVRIKKTGSS